MGKAFLIITLFSLAISNQSTSECFPTSPYQPKNIINKGEYVLSADKSAIKWKDTTYYYASKLRTCRYALIPVTLNNNTADTLKYIDMSCSTLDIFTTDTKNARIFQNLENCFKNNATTVTLAPYGIIEFNVPVYFFNDDTHLSQILTPKLFKLGMGLFKSTDRTSMLQDLNDRMIREKANILWSNTITIP